MNKIKNSKVQSWEKLVEYLADFNLLFLSVDDQALNKLLPYEEENIVSRVLTRNDAGVVELHAFDADQTLYENSGCSKMLLQIVEGEATLIVGRKITQATPGMLVYIPTGTSYIISSRKPVKMLMVYAQEQKTKNFVNQTAKAVVC